MSDQSAVTTDHVIDVASGEVQDAAFVEEERRNGERHLYTRLVAAVFATSSNGRSEPYVVRARDLSVGGISVQGEDALTEGARGALQLVRSDGRAALVGVVVRHCTPTDDRAYISGLEFDGLPDGMSVDEFIDELGQMTLIDPIIAGSSGQP